MTSTTPPNDLSIRGSRSSTLWLATLGFFGGFAGVAIFGPLVPKFLVILHLVPWQAGVLAGIPNLTGSLLRIPFGAWVDRDGGRRPFLTLLLITIVGIAGLLALLHNAYPDHMAGLFPVLLLLGVCIGSGIASFSVGIGQVSYWYPRNQQGGPLGIYAGLGNTAPGLSSWLLPLAVVSFGMLAAYGLWFVVLIIITIIYAFSVHDAPYFQLRRQGVAVDMRQLAAIGQDLIPTGSVLGGLRLAAQTPATWALVYLYFVSFGGFLALTAWLPTFWHSMYATTLPEGGLLTLIFSLLTALVRVPGGLLSDRISIRFALTGNLLLIGLGTLLVATSHTFGVSLTGTILVAIGMGLQNAIVFKLLPHYIPHAVGGASGWIGGLGALNGFILPPLLGGVAGAVGAPMGYAQAFLAITGLAVLGLLDIGWLTHWRWQTVLERHGPWHA